MRYFGLLLIPLLVVLIFAGPGCQRAQDEPEVQMEQAVEEPAEAPMMEEAPAAMEEIEIEEEVEVEVETEKEGSGLLKQLQEKGEEEAQKKADEYEVEKKIDDLGM